MSTQEQGVPKRERILSNAQVKKIRAEMKQSKTATPVPVRKIGPDETPKTEKKGKLSTAEARREYQRRYYQMNKEKAKEYQRQYNLTHKKKARGGRGKSSFIAPREVIRTTYNTTDIMHSPVEKTVRMLEKIISGERFFVI